MMQLGINLSTLTLQGATISQVGFDLSTLTLQEVAMLQLEERV